GRADLPCRARCAAHRESNFHFGVRRAQEATLRARRRDQGRRSGARREAEPRRPRHHRALPEGEAVAWPRRLARGGIHRAAVVGAESDRRRADVWRIAMFDARREYHRQYHKKNRARLLAQKREHYLIHREAFLARQRQYRIRNADKIREYSRRRYRENKE